MAVAVAMAAREAERMAPTGAPSAELLADQIESRVAELSGLLNATHAALVDAIAELVATDSWGGGYRSPENWVALHCGVGRGQAVQLVAAARRMADLPRVAARFRAGELSVDQAVAVLRRAPASEDARMAELAPTLSVGQLRQVLASLPPLDRKPEPEPDADADPRPDDEKGEAQPESEPRYLLGHVTDSGSYLLRIGMPGDIGALFDKAMKAARADLLDLKIAGVDSVAAFERVLNLALDSLDPAAARGERPGERYQVMLHLDRRGDDPVTRIQPHLGTWLPAGLSRYLTCDCTVRLALYDTDDDGTKRLVGFSPQARVVDAKTRAAIEHRDRGCRVPGCEQRTWLHIHHIRHWEHGGSTEARNLVALCPHHHRLHHLGLITIEGDPERLAGLQVTDRWGRPVGASPPTPPGDDLFGAAEHLEVPHGSGWTHPWGLPMDTRSYSWNRRAGRAEMRGAAR